MKFFTGDESGLVKAITIRRAPTEKDSTSLKRPAKPAAAENPEDAVQTTIQTWGKLDKKRGVRLMCASSEQDGKKIVVARQDGRIEFLDPAANGRIVREFVEEKVGNEKTDGRFVGLFANSSTLMTCTSLGTVTYRPILDDNIMPTTFNLTPDLERMRVHPKEHHIFACGGKERDLTIWDVNAYREGTATLMMNGEASDSKYKKPKEAEPGLVWRAKNVKNDFLDIRVPIWITDLQFLGDGTTKIVTGTRHHKIRVYDTKAARRPVLDVEIGENPVVSLVVGCNQNEIVFSDTTSNVYSVDVRTGKVLGQFTGFAGSVNHLAVHTPSFDESTSYLASVGLDRFLHVHRMKDERKRVHKLYLKQRLTCVLFEEDPDDDQRVVGETEQERTKDDELWEKMEKVNERQRKKQKI